MEIHKILFSLFVLFFIILPSEGSNYLEMGTNQVEYITVKEKTEANFSYQLRANTSETFMGTAFILESQLFQNGTHSVLCRCRWLHENNTRCKNLTNVSICEADHSKMRLSLLIRRSYTHIMWILLKNSSTHRLVKNTTLNVEYPAKVTGLQVNGRRVNETHVLDQNEEANISCSFTNGNPPVSVLLLDNNKSEHSSSSQEEGSLVISRVFHCHNVWPTIRCEAPHSELNDSLAILVRCPPQFSSSTVDFDNSQIQYGDLMIGIKSHTILIKECRMRDSSLNYEEKNISCNVSGDPPDLTLSLHLATESWIGEGKWTLFLTNSFGTSNITLNIKNKKPQNDKPDFQKRILLVVFGCLVCVTIVAAAAVISCIIKRSKPRQSVEKTDSHVAATRTEHQGLVSTRRSTDGLVYGELDFSDMRTSDSIIGSLLETQYAVIACTALSENL